MTARQTLKTLFTEATVWQTICFFAPVKRIKGRWFIMRPYWCNGHFGMKSINKWKS